MDNLNIKTVRFAKKIVGMANNTGILTRRRAAADKLKKLEKLHAIQSAKRPVIKVVANPSNPTPVLREAGAGIFASFIGTVLLIIVIATVGYSMLSDTATFYLNTLIPNLTTAVAYLAIIAAVIGVAGYLIGFTIKSLIKHSFKKGT